LKGDAEIGHAHSCQCWSGSRQAAACVDRVEKEGRDGKEGKKVKKLKEKRGREKQVRKEKK
jgi:hypothetical protein